MFTVVHICINSVCAHLCVCVLTSTISKVTSLHSRGFFSPLDAFYCVSERSIPICLIIGALEAFMLLMIDKSWVTLQWKVLLMIWRPLVVYVVPRLR